MSGSNCCGLVLQETTVVRKVLRQYSVQIFEAPPLLLRSRFFGSRVWFIDQMINLILCVLVVIEQIINLTLCVLLPPY